MLLRSRTMAGGPLDSLTNRYPSCGSSVASHGAREVLYPSLRWLTSPPEAVAEARSAAGDGAPPLLTTGFPPRPPMKQPDWADGRVRTSLVLSPAIERRTGRYCKLFGCGLFRVRVSTPQPHLPHEITPGTGSTCCKTGKQWRVLAALLSPGWPELVSLCHPFFVSSGPMSTRGWPIYITLLNGTGSVPTRVHMFCSSILSIVLVVSTS